MLTALLLFLYLVVLPIATIFVAINWHRLDNPRKKRERIKC